MTKYVYFVSVISRGGAHPATHFISEFWLEEPITRLAHIHLIQKTLEDRIVADGEAPFGLCVLNFQLLRTEDEPATPILADGWPSGTSEVPA